MKDLGPSYGNRQRMRQLIAGNWKMNGVSGSLADVSAVARVLRAEAPACDVLICPPFTLLSRAVDASCSEIMFGGQDCHAEAFGAFTGEVSAEMLRDAGASAVIVGHSERRQLHAETNSLISAKATAAWRAGLLAITCIGETLSEREAGQAQSVCENQLKESVPRGATPANTVIAYEPVWAIGTGRTPTNSEIAKMHGHIRSIVGPSLRILYGGSVKPANAGEILALPNVGGALVGGASLMASDFLAIIGSSRSA